MTVNGENRNERTEPSRKEQIGVEQKKAAGILCSLSSPGSSRIKGRERSGGRASLPLGSLA